MIKIYVGNVGSGKSACAVREMCSMTSGRAVYSNIITKGVKYNRIIDPSMIIEKQLVAVKKKRDGTEEPVFDYKLNMDFWKSINEPVDVILDEAHAIINSRRSMSKINILLGDWLALVRRVIGQSESGYGRLILISQLLRKIDVNARDMATQVRYHRCHYLKSCRKCSNTWCENSDSAEPIWQCFNCGSYSVVKHSHRIEVWHFSDASSFIGWKDFGMNTFHRHYMVNDIEEYFPKYNTLQWDNLFSEFY